MPKTTFNNMQCKIMYEIHSQFALIPDVAKISWVGHD